MSITMEIIPGTIEDLEFIIEKLNEAIEFHKFSIQRDIDYLIVTKIQMLHKKYAVNKKMTTYERYSSLEQKKIEIDAMYKEYFGTSSKSDSLLNTTRKNLLYKYDTYRKRHNNEIKES